MTGSGERDRLGYGGSSATDPEAAARAAVRAALGGRVPSAADLVLVFPTTDYPPRQFLAGALQAAGAAQVVGGTAYAGSTGNSPWCR